MIGCGGYWMERGVGVARCNGGPQPESNAIMEHTSALPSAHTFSAGRAGRWQIDRISRVTGEVLPSADRLELFVGDRRASVGEVWSLWGV